MLKIFLFTAVCCWIHIRAYSQSNDTTEIQEIIDSYSFIIGLGKGDTTAFHAARGDLYIDIGKYDSALIDFKKYFYKFRKPDNAVTIGNVFRFMAKEYQTKSFYDTAAYWYDKALEIDPDNFKATFEFARLYYEIKKYDKALPYYEQLYDKWPVITVGDTGYMIREDLGFVYLYIGKNDKVVDLYDSLIDMDSTNHWLFLRRAIAFLKLRYYAQAERDYDYVLNLTDYSDLARSSKANYYAVRRMYDEACSIIDRNDIQDLQKKYDFSCDEINEK